MKKFMYWIMFQSMDVIVRDWSTDLFVFEPLDRTWSTEGQWGDGNMFTGYGLQSVDVKNVGQETNLLGFYEYGVFGGIAKGRINVESEDIHYLYTNGAAKITDAWLPMNKDYNRLFVVDMLSSKMLLSGSWTGKEWDDSLKEQFDNSAYIKLCRVRYQFLHSSENFRSISGSEL